LDVGITLIAFVPHTRGIFANIHILYISRN